MLIYLLKSGVCLAVFYGFYKFLLEKESIHTFKRYYLLASVVLAFIIPFITFTEYIKVTPQNVPSFYSDVPLTNTIIEVEPINYASIILWTIYGLGVLLFSIKFFKNLSQLLYKIKHNTKVKVNQITNVLLQDLIVPHTFFNYIFLNKQKFETQQIPKEVLLHEETHAQQKHSLDVLFIEILQILFWFNPFIYFIKRSIKLNHEFLADQAVINNGVIPSTYQQILLAFSSNASEPPLANAINYSSIKKRFTVMKTHTSKQAFWLRSLILLPLLALLIYSFSEKKVIEKPQVYQIVNGDIKVVISKDKKVTIGNETIDFNLFSDKLIELTKNEKIKPLVSIEIQDHLDAQYLTEIKNELKKADLDIFSINATSIYFDDEIYLNINNYEHTIRYSSDTIIIKDKNGGLSKGISTSDDMYFTVPQIQSNSKNDIAKALESKKSEQTNNSFFYINKKGEVVAQKMQKATLEDNISIAINKKGDLLVNNSIVEINDLKKLLNDLTKNLTLEEKENITVKLISNSAPTEIITKVKAILRESKLLKINLIESQQKIVEIPKNSSQPLIPVNATAEQKAQHKKTIDDYAKEHPEAMTKIKSKSGETIEIVEIPMDSIPPPPPPVEKETEDHTKESLEARKRFFEKANTYGEAMQIYFKEKKGNLSDLKTQYEEVMELYNSYQKLLKKENVLPPPPPPPAKN